MKILRHQYIQISGYSFTIAGILLSAAALAEPPPVPSAPPHPGIDHPGRDMPPPLPGALIDAQLAFMKTALKLTDAQLPAWNAVADTLREQAKGRDAEITSHRTAPETAAQPDDLIAHLQERQHTAVLEADNLAELLIALKPLYVVLSDDQKEIAGHLFPPGRRGDGPPPPDMDGPPHCPPLFRTESR